jgi:hypothetical protein
MAAATALAMFGIVAGCKPKGAGSTVKGASDTADQAMLKIRAFTEQSSSGFFIGRSREEIDRERPNNDKEKEDLDELKANKEITDLAFMSLQHIADANQTGPNRKLSWSAVSSLINARSAAGFDDSATYAKSYTLKYFKSCNGEGECTGELTNLAAMADTCPTCVFLALKGFDGHGKFGKEVFSIAEEQVTDMAKSIAGLKESGLAKSLRLDARALLIQAKLVMELQTDREDLRGLTPDLDEKYWTLISDGADDYLEAYKKSFGIKKESELEKEFASELKQRFDNYLFNGSTNGVPNVFAPSPQSAPGAAGPAGGAAPASGAAPAAGPAASPTGFASLTDDEQNGGSSASGADDVFGGSGDDLPNAFAPLSAEEEAAAAEVLADPTILAKDAVYGLINTYNGVVAVQFYLRRLGLTDPRPWLRAMLAARSDVAFQAMHRFAKFEWGLPYREDYIATMAELMRDLPLVPEEPNNPTSRLVPNPIYVALFNTDYGAFERKRESLIGAFGQKDPSEVEPNERGFMADILPSTTETASGCPEINAAATQTFFVESPYRKKQMQEFGGEGKSAILPRVYLAERALAKIFPDFQSLQYRQARLNKFNQAYQRALMLREHFEEERTGGAEAPWWLAAFWDTVIEAGDIGYETIGGVPETKMVKEQPEIALRSFLTEYVTMQCYNHATYFLYPKSPSGVDTEGPFRDVKPSPPPKAVCFNGLKFDLEKICYNGQLPSPKEAMKFIPFAKRVHDYLTDDYINRQNETEMWQNVLNRGMFFGNFAVMSGAGTFSHIVTKGVVKTAVRKGIAYTTLKAGIGYILRKLGYKYLMGIANFEAFTLASNAMNAAIYGTFMQDWETAKAQFFGAYHNHFMHMLLGGATFAIQPFAGKRADRFASRLLKIPNAVRLARDSRSVLGFLGRRAGFCVITTGIDGAFFVTSGYIEEHVTAAWDWAWGHPNPNFASVQAYKKSVVEREPKGMMHSIAVAGGFRLMHGCGAHFNLGSTVGDVNLAMAKAEGAKALFLENYKLKPSEVKLHPWNWGRMARDLRNVRALQGEVADAFRSNLLSGPTDTDTLAKLFPELLSEGMPGTYGNLKGVEPIALRKYVPEKLREKNPELIEKFKAASKDPRKLNKLIEELRLESALNRTEIEALTKEARGMIDAELVPAVWAPFASKSQASSNQGKGNVEAVQRDLDENEKEPGDREFAPEQTLPDAPEGGDFGLRGDESGE